MVLFRRLCVGVLFFLAMSGARDVFAFPQIVVQPASLSVSSNTLVTFSVGVTQLTNSLSPLSVQWRRNGANIPEALTTFTNLHVGDTVFSTLTITNAQPSDAGNYYAAAFDADGAMNTTNVSLVITNLQSLPTGNVFTNRGFITGSSGAGIADNFTATNEPGAPNNGSIPGGAMVWLAWKAPDSGVATFNTEGSDFDTTLGIYVIGTNGVESVTNLVAISGDDDAGGYFSSAVSFNVTNGVEYEIGIDGYYGDRGNIVLNWFMQSTTNQLPVIIQQPQSQTVSSNVSVFLSVTVNTNSGNPLLFQWFFNGAAIPGATFGFVGHSRRLAFNSWTISRAGGIYE